MKQKVALSLAALVATCLILSPLVHELVHVVMLDYFSGSYSMSLSVLPSVHASERILSPLTTYQYIALLSSGILASLLIGAFLVRRGRKNMCHISAMSGIGFFMNPALCMFSGNDFTTLLSFFNLSALSAITGIALVGLCAYEVNFAAKMLSCE